MTNSIQIFLKNHGMSPLPESKKCIKRSDFLNFNFPILPYCEIKRGPATQYNDSIHIQNISTGTILNFYWNNNKTVSVCIFNSKENNPFKQANVVLAATNNFNQDTINKLCYRFLITGK